jgi:hypothetical protein
LIFFRVMAEVVDKDGVKNLVAHEDAPEFHEFAQRVEALPPPVSFRSTTAYSAGTPSAEALLTGEILVVPFLQFSLKSQADAVVMAETLFEYASKAGCT